MARSEKTDLTPETPRQVRHTAAVTIGAAVGVTAAPLPPLVQVIALVVLLGAGTLVIFSHPYRRKVAAAVEARGDVYSTRVKQIVPLFPLWLALMVLIGVRPANWVIAVIVWGVAAAFTWQMVPRIDGTKELEEIAAAEARRQ
jgi:hypothetical protein